MSDTGQQPIAASGADGQDQKLKSIFDEARGFPGQFEGLVVELRDAIEDHMTAVSALQDGSIPDEQKQEFVKDRNVALGRLALYMETIAENFPDHPRAGPMMVAGLDRLHPSGAAYHAREVVEKAEKGSVVQDSMAHAALIFADAVLTASEGTDAYPITLHRMSYIALDVAGYVPSGVKVQDRAIGFVLENIPELFKNRQKIIEADLMNEGYPDFFLRRIASVIEGNPKDEHISGLKQVVETVDEILIGSLRDIKPRSIKPAATDAAGNPPAP